jgi:hypothetical protein
MESELHHGKIVSTSKSARSSPTTQDSEVGHKIDSKQITIDTDDQKIYLWRRLLHLRYFEQAGDLNNVHIKWTDSDKATKTINVGDEEHVFSMAAPCSELFKTVIRIDVNNKKLLTITIFYTTNRILIQGVSCQDWLHSEFDRLRTMINTIHGELLTNADKTTQTSCVNQVCTLPLPITIQPAGPDTEIADAEIAAATTTDIPAIDSQLTEARRETTPTKVTSTSTSSLESSPLWSVTSQIPYNHKNIIHLQTPCL